MLRFCFLSSFVEFRSEEKSKMSQPIRGQGGHLVFLIGPKNTNSVETLRSCLLSLNSVQRFHQRSRKCLSQSEARAAILFFRWPEKQKQEAKRATYRAPEYNMPPFWGIGQGRHFCLLIGPKNTNLVEDVEILLPVKFRWIPFRAFRGEVKNVSANQRPGRPSCFSDGPEKHKLGREHWDLASCQVSLNSVQRFQRRSRKCLSQSEARVAILFFRSAQKHKFGRGRWDLASCQVSLNSVQRFQRRSRKCLSQSEARAAILFFRSAQKKTNLVEDIEILLPVKFRWILFSGFRGEVENVSANQKPGWPSCFSDRPKKTQTN